MNDIGAPDPQGAWLYQDLVTTAATNYTLSFEFSSGGAPVQELEVLWGGNVILDLTNVAAGPYSLYTIGNLTGSAGTTRLEFIGRQDPSYNGLDAVCVSTSTDCGSVSAVPEPGTFSMLGGGFAGLGIFALRRKAAFLRA
ncbi:MAG TPA: PEP-CTERM sorting domain-containing protein [Bryobacteraceae bacterium]